MNKNTLIALLSILTVAFAGLAAWQAFSPPAQAPAPTVASAPEAAEPAGLEDGERTRLLARIQDLENQLAAARAAATAQAFTPTPASIPGNEPPAETDGPAIMLSEVAAMMQEPEFQDMMRSQQKLVMDQFYGELFRALDLDPQKLAEFKDLLASRMLAGMDLGMSMFGQDGAPDRETLMNAFQEAQAQVNESIRELLSEEEYELFEQYEATQAERTQVDMFKQSLPPDLTLNWEQEDALILAMHEESQAAGNPPGMDPTMGGLPPEGFDSDAMISSMEQMHGRYVQRAADILNDQQLSQFEASLQQQRNMQAMSMRMMQRMMGRDEPPPPPPTP